MKRLTFIIAIIFIQLAGNSQTQDLKTGDFLWLAGTWFNSGSDDYEHWEVDTLKGKISGYAFSLSGNDTLFTEQMLIRKEAGKFFFVANVPQNPAPIPFEIVSTAKNSFRSENLKHDFPNFISYNLVSKGNLLAEIGNQYRTIRFEFIQVKEGVSR